MNSKKNSPLPLKVRMAFYRQLSKKLASGIAMNTALQQARKWSGGKAGNEIVLVLRDLERGLTFGEAAARRPVLFPKPLDYLVCLGEEAGELPAMLDRMVREVQDHLAARRRVMSLMVYPTVILAVWVFLFPATQASFRWAETASIAQAVGKYFQDVVSHALSLAAIGAVIMVTVRLVSGRMKPVAKQRLLESLPVFGAILQKRDWANLSGTVSIGLSAGLPLDRTLRLAARALGHPILIEKAETICGDVANGKSFSDSVREAGLFPDDAVGAIHTGEVTGSLDEALGNLAADWRQELEATAGNVAAVMPRIVLLLLAVAVVIMVASQYLAYLEFILGAT
jgi:type II secretory pathway component PulF